MSTATAAAKGRSSRAAIYRAPDLDALHRGGPPRGDQRASTPRCVSSVGTWEREVEVPHHRPGEGVNISLSSPARILSAWTSSVSAFDQLIRVQVEKYLRGFELGHTECSSILSGAWAATPAPWLQVSASRNAARRAPVPRRERVAEPTPTLRKTCCPVHALQVAPCVECKTTGATSPKREDGIVVINREEASAARSAWGPAPTRPVPVGPSEDSYFGAELNVKLRGADVPGHAGRRRGPCTFCAERIDAGDGQVQACVAACRPGPACSATWTAAQPG